MPRLLIVNADDFGLTERVSAAIIRAHRDGIVTSTSLLCLAPGFATTAAWLDDAPTLGLGAHLALVGEDPPLLTAREIPTLVDRSGRLAASWKQLLPRAAAGRVNSADVERELEAQMACIQQATGNRPLTHVDTHQHVHLWPSIGAVVVRVATRHGIAAARRTGSGARSPVGAVLNRLAKRFAKRANGAGIAVPAAFAGFDEGGAMDEDRLVDTIGRLGAAGVVSAEIGAHPGERDDPALARYEWGYRWGDELDALTSARVREKVTASGFELGTFADLLSRA